MSDARREAGTPWRAALRSASAIGVANAVAEVLLFGAFVAPALAAGERVGLATWALVYLPVFAAAVWVLGAVSRLRDAIAAGVAAGVVAQLEKWALAVVGATGHESALAATAPDRFWGVHFARMTFGFVALFLVLHFAKRLLEKRRASP